MGGPRHYGNHKHHNDDDEEPELFIQSWEVDYEDDEGSDDYISIDEAVDIWLSHGKDEDYTCGYTWEELEDALQNS